jgi:uncharacterized phage protein (TIGR01671 family)
MAKFRSWNEENNMFFYFKDGKYYLDSWLKIQCTDTIDFDWGNAEQSTGLFDKNDIEIFKGDIILYNSNGHKAEKVIVEYVDDMFHCKSTRYPNLSNGNYRLATICRNNGVLGNIHENPELLERK